jgi:hypothetical protein
MPAKGVRQRADVFHDFFHRMHGREQDDAFLKIDDNECGLLVEGGHGHGIFLLMIWRTANRPLHFVPGAASILGAN